MRIRGTCGTPVPAGVGERTGVELGIRSVALVVFTPPPRHQESVSVLGASSFHNASAALLLT